MRNTNYRELKEFLNSLTDEQLDQEIDFSVTEYKNFDHVYSAITKEDYVVSDVCDEPSPLSSLEPGDLLGGVVVVLKKGTVVLSVD